MRKYTLKLKTPKTLTLPIPGWPKGLNTIVNAQSIDDQELAEAVNVAYTQYGVLSKRAGTSLIVTLPTNPVQGFGTFYYVNSDGSLTRYFLVIAGGVMYSIDPINLAYTTISGFTFHPTNKVTMKQAYNFLYIFDGFNTMVKWDGSAFTQYTALSDPGTLTITKNGSGTGTGSYFYVIAAFNETGETNITNEVSLTTMPTPLTTTTYLTLSWPAVSGAAGYNVYKGNYAGDEFFLTSTQSNSFIDQGQYDSGQSNVLTPPNENTTSGHTFLLAEIYKETIYGVDKDNPYRLWYSGGLQFIDSFAAGNGGGYIDYHAEEGSPITGLKAFAGLGKDYLYIFKDHKIGQGSFGSANEFIVSDVNLSIGASSNLSIIPFENDMGFWSRYGAYTLRMEQAYLNVLRVAELTAKVHDSYVAPIQPSAVGGACGIYDKNNHVIVWSLPLGAVSNNTSLAFDTIYQAFSEYRGIVATAFSTFVDTNNNEFSFGGNTAGQIFRLFNGASDLGSPIYFRAATKVYDMKQFMAYKFLIRIFFLFGNVNASNFICTLIRDGTVEVGQFAITSGQGAAGWGTDFWGEVLWGESSGTPLGVNARSVLRYFDINKNILNIQAIFEDTSASDTFEILSMALAYQQSNTPLPSSYKIQAS